MKPPSGASQAFPFQRHPMTTSSWALTLVPHVSTMFPPSYRLLSPAQPGQGLNTTRVDVWKLLIKFVLCLLFSSSFILRMSPSISHYFNFLFSASGLMQLLGELMRWWLCGAERLHANFFYMNNYDAISFLSFSVSNSRVWVFISFRPPTNCRKSLQLCKLV